MESQNALPETTGEHTNTLPAGTNHGNGHANTGGDDGETVDPDLVGGSGTLPPELQRVYNSERWVPDKNTRIKYPTPEELIDPMLDTIAQKGLSASFNTHTARARTVEENGSEATQHTAYGRVLVEAEWGRPTGHGTMKTTGLVYDLTRKDPIIKTYAGHNVSACVNLLIFDATRVFEGSLLKSGEQQAHAHIEDYLDELPEVEGELMDLCSKLKETTLQEPELNQLIGKLLRDVHAHNTFGAATLNHAVKLLDDNNSKYALDRNGTTSAWNFLQAMTQYVTDSTKQGERIHLVPDKSLEICQRVADPFFDVDDERLN